MASPKLIVKMFRDAEGGVPKQLSKTLKGDHTVSLIFYMPSLLQMILQTSSLCC